MTGGEAPERAPQPTAEVEMTAIVRFIEEMARIPDPKVVELGTRRQASQERTRHIVWVPHAREYVGVDYEPGDDVDVVADAHELSKHFAAESVDAVVACSIFEHIKYPWIATAEIAKILRIGGLAFIHTHQTFALHAHPHDYWRFSMEGLAALFPVTLGFEVLSCHYQYPCRIVTPDDPLQAQNPSYLERVSWSPGRSGRRRTPSSPTSAGESLARRSVAGGGRQQVADQQDVQVHQHELVPRRRGVECLARVGELGLEDSCQCRLGQAHRTDHELGGNLAAGAGSAMAVGDGHAEDIVRRPPRASRSPPTREATGRGCASAARCAPGQASRPPS